MSAILKAAIMMEAADDFGALHIVVSDGNVDDGNLDFCRALPTLTPDEAELLDVLKEMPVEARDAAYLLSVELTNRVVSMTDLILPTEEQAEIKRLRGALSFYAGAWTTNKDKWYDVTLVEGAIVPSPDLLSDEGDIAKAALNV